MRANQLRPWFASMAYVLLAALRRIDLAHTRLASATCGSIRLKLLKIGVQIRLSTRRIRIAMASACPHAAEFTHGLVGRLTDLEALASSIGFNIAGPTPFRTRGDGGIITSWVSVDPDRSVPRRYHEHVANHNRRGLRAPSPRPVGAPRGPWRPRGGRHAQGVPRTWNSS